MTEQDSDEIRTIDTQGGAYVAGQVDTRGGQFIGRDLKIFNVSLPMMPVVVILVAVILVMAYLVLPKRPKAMTGLFNIAVAEFSVLNSEGQPLRTEDGKKFAEFLHQRLVTEFAGLGLTIPYEIWSPEYTGLIPGGDPAERARSPGALADRINANILVYGVINKAEDSSRVYPEFYVNYRGFEQAQEITGEHELGKSIRLDLPFDPAQFQGVDNPALTARIQVLNLITVGLAYYSTDNLNQALEYFSRGEATPGWLSNAGKEVVYLLLGNTEARMASQAKSPELLESALAHYERALSINPDYARAKVGRAGVYYLLALGDPNVSSFDTVNDELLDQADAEYEAALTFDAPESANIDEKVHFGLGQVYLVRAQIEAGEWTVRAKNEFNQVIAAYQSGDPRLTDLAGHAYARLGLIALLEGDADNAASNYEMASKLVTPYWQGIYKARIGEIYVDVGEIDLALRAFQEAVQIAEQFGDEESAERYLDRVREIEANTK